ncbi:MAG: hypothetical protein H6765_02125 [Candidatus Peribacteria bacterium]|nr:MAG: hypothetical protein H6765_02125 [Candidatus Peribacteria bacterium]
MEYGDHLVDQYNNFTSLNIPPTHPATEMHDTLYIKQTDAKTTINFSSGPILRSWTTNLSRNMGLHANL